MTLQEYVNWMFTSGTEAAYLCIGLSAFFVLASLGEFFSGFRRGIGRELLHAVFTVVSLFLSFIITNALIGELHTLFSSHTIADMLEGIESAIPNLEISADIHNIIASIDTHLAELILTLPIATLVAPIAFLVIFAIVNILARIVFWIVGRVVPARQGFVSGILGMAVGLAEGVIVASLSLLPFAAVSDTISYAVEEMAEDDVQNEQITAFYEDYVKPMSETPVFTLTYMLGGEAMLDEFASVDVGYGEIDMRDELGCAVDIISSLAAFKETDWTSLTADEQAALSHIVDTISDSEYFSDVFSGLFITVSNMSDTLGLGNEEGELFGALLDDMMLIFKTSTRENIALDLNTFKNMYFILLDSGILSAYNGEGGSDAVLDALISTDSEGKTAITRIIDTLSLNPRTSPIVSTLTKLSVSIMAESLGLDEDAAAIYENVKDGVNDILSINHEDYATPEEYKAAVADSLEGTLSGQGITLEREIIDGMADYVEKNFKEHDELSDEDINKIILSYYDAFVGMNAE